MTNSKNSNKIIFFDLRYAAEIASNNGCLGSFCVNSSELDEISVDAILRYIFNNKEKFFEKIIKGNIIEICGIDYSNVKVQCIRSNANGKMYYYIISNIHVL